VNRNVLKVANTLFAEKTVIEIVGRVAEGFFHFQGRNRRGME